MSRCIRKHKNFTDSRDVRLLSKFLLSHGNGREIENCFSLLEDEDVITLDQYGEWIRVSQASLTSLRPTIRTTKGKESKWKCKVIKKGVISI